MALENKKRPKRVPLTNEEVANVIAFKKRRDLMRRLKLKSSLPYKLQNIFNIACFSISLELIFCFLFPTNYESHLSKSIRVQYGDVYRANERMVSKITLKDFDGREYEMVVEDFMTLQDGQEHSFFISKDYLLCKELKARLNGVEEDYALFNASPLLLICVFNIVISLSIYANNLNENAHSLLALTVLNGLTLLSFLAI